MADDKEAREAARRANADKKEAQRDHIKALGDWAQNGIEEIRRRNSTK